MATSQVYEYVAATIVKSVTEKTPLTAGRGAAGYDDARAFMSRDESRQYVLEARNEADGISFRYGEFTGSPHVEFGSWHLLPRELASEAASHLGSGQVTKTVTVRYRELDEFIFS